MTQYDIYGIGAALVDTEIEVTDTDLREMGIDKGVMTLIDETQQNSMISHLSGHLMHAKRASGGSAANSVIAASYFGAKTFYSCLVADDDNGKLYLSDLRNAGVDVHANNGTLSGTSGKCLVLLTSDAERTMGTYLGISEQLSIADIDEHALSNSRFCYIEGYLVTSETGRPAAIHLRELAAKNQVKTAVSLSDPFIAEHFRDGMKEIIGSEKIEIIFANEAEAMSFTETDSFEAAFDALKAYAKTFAITRGGDGAVVFDGEKALSIPPVKIDAVDTLGAGDMFAGAFLYATTKGFDMTTAGTFACKAAATVVSQFGPRLQAEQYGALLEDLKAL